MTLGDDAKKLWEKYDVRSFALISIGIQFFLLLAAPLRKRTKSQLVHFPIWLAYTVADWFAIFAMGLIFDDPVSRPTNPDLLLYWAPFLLLHLGGPDTITAYSFEDNELWARHLLQFIGQTVTTGYLVFQSLYTKKLFAPTLLIFLAGFIKYGERIRSLYLASLGKFRSSLQAVLANESSDIDERTRVLNGLSEGAADESAQQMMKKAFSLFNFFKRLVLDINFTIDERDQIRDYFLNIRSGEVAFRILEIELNLFYEVLCTKVIAFRQRLGYILRLLSFFFNLISLLLWIFIVDKVGMHKVDVKITYALLICALAVDIIASMGLAFSDWMIGHSLHNSNNFAFSLLTKMVPLKELTWSRYPTDVRTIVPRRGQRVMLFYRWSASIPQYNLKSMGRPDCIQRLFGRSIPLSNYLMEFIFNEIRAKAQRAKDNPDDAKSISSARGEWILRESLINDWPHLVPVLINPYTVDMEYDKSLILWYNATNSVQVDGNSSRQQRYCEVLSNYMMYLIIKQPTLMSTVADIGESRHLNISQEVDLQEMTENAVERLTGRSLRLELDRLGQADWVITSKVWVELLCYAAIKCRPRNLISQVSDGGELITFVWALMTHFGLGKRYRN